MRHTFLLFVAGPTALAEQAERSVRRFIDERLEGAASLKVVDVLREPQEAEVHRVLATPTLVRLEPEPVRRVVGSMEALDALSRALDIDPLA